MHPAIRFAGVLLVAAHMAGAEPQEVKTAQDDSTKRLWFPVGEQLTYRIYWGIIPVGITRITTDWVDPDRKEQLRIRYKTRSNKVIATIYPVDDLIEAIIAPEAFLPIRFTKDLNEGRHEVSEETTFDHRNLHATWTSHTKGKKKTYAIDADTRDIVTFMYFMRSHDPATLGDTPFRVMADEKIYDLSIDILRREPVKLPRYGRVASIKMEPKAAFNGLFIRKGRMFVWVSEDERHLCTKIVASVPVASIKVVLCNVDGPGTDFWVTKDSGDDPACKEETD